ncbi:MAG: hypothetical protein WD738_23325 [Pirellulales bacterium]
MRVDRQHRTTDGRTILDRRLAAYLTAAGAVGTAMASEAQAVVVHNTTVQPFGINGAVPIDFNSDGQVDYEIDHDRVDLGGGNIVDYLQLDKNDTNGASPGENPCPINVFDTFPLNGTFPNDTADAAYVIPTLTQGDYPAALTDGTLIGPASSFDFQEGDNFQGSGRTIRANRLIDEDAGQCDQALCGLTAAQVQVPTNGPNFVGLSGDIRYLGVKMDLQSAGPVTYGWIGVRITNELDATGEVVGWGYETSGAPIRAGQVPEPGSIISAFVGAAMIAVCFLRKRFFGR